MYACSSPRKNSIVLITISIYIQEHIESQLNKGLIVFSCAHIVVIAVPQYKYNVKGIGVSKDNESCRFLIKRNENSRKIARSTLYKFQNLAHIF